MRTEFSLLPTPRARRTVETAPLRFRDETAELLELNKSSKVLRWCDKRVRRVGCGNEPEPDGRSQTKTVEPLDMVEHTQHEAMRGVCLAEPLIDATLRNPLGLTSGLVHGKGMRKIPGDKRL